MSFIFGGNTGQTYEGMKRQRELANMLLKRSNGMPKTAIEGINMALDDVVGMTHQRRADKAENAGREAFGESLSGVMGGESSLSDIAGLLGNPYASSGQQAVLAQMLQQRMTPEDPMDAINLEKAQLELEALRNPKPGKRDTMKAADGYQYYVDDGSRVFPDVVAKPDDPLVNVNLNEGELSPGWEAIDKGYADRYIEWTGAGAGDMASQISQIAPVLQALENGEELTGPMIGAQPDFMRALTNPDAQDAIDNVSGVVQRNLRVILGAQFTNEEGKRLIERAYNPSLKPEMNARRLRRLFEQMQLAYENENARAAYFEQNGTLRGFQGSMRAPSIADFDRALDEVGAPPSGEQTATAQPNKPLSEMTDEELDALLPPETPAPPTEPDPRPGSAVSGGPAQKSLVDLTGPVFDEFMLQWRKFREGK